MSKLIDLIGKKFYRLLVIKRVENDKWNKPQWLCLCDCGNKTIVKGGCLREGTIKSCGCFRNEIQKQIHIKHGHNKKHKRSSTYSSWNAMIQRCNNKKCKEYKNYGGRGITVCKKWQGKNGFINFLKNMGERPKGKTLDKINNNKQYQQSNCRWATKKEQNRNKRNTNKLFFNNKWSYLVDLAKNYNISNGVLWNRIYILKWSIKKALTTSIKKIKRRKK